MFRQHPDTIQEIYGAYQKRPAKLAVPNQAPYQKETPLLKESGLLQKPLPEDTFHQSNSRQASPPSDTSRLTRLLSLGQLLSFKAAKTEAEKVAKDTYQAKGKEWAFQQQQLATQRAIDIGLERLTKQNEELAQLKADINELGIIYAAQEQLHDNALYPRDDTNSRNRYERLKGGGLRYASNTNNIANATLALQTSPFLISPYSNRDFNRAIEAKLDGSLTCDKSAPPATLESLPPEKASLVLEYKHHMRQLKSKIIPLRKSYFEKLEGVHREQALLERLMQDNDSII